MTPAIRELQEKNIPHRIFTHAGPVKSLEQAAEERGQRPGQVVRSLVFRLNEGEYLMVLIAGPAQVPWKTLRAYVGQRRLTTASKEELLSVTGYQIGAVTPFGLPNPLRVLVDATVLSETELSLGSGTRGTTIILKQENLMKGLGDVEIVNLFQKKS